MKTNLNGVVPLTQWGVIRAEGEEAASFLQGQLTQDVLLLQPTQARLAAFCSAKGRMQASFYVLKRSPSEILLLCRQDILAPTLKRLSMFVMRAKVKMTDVSADYALYGLTGEAATRTEAGSLAVWSKADIGPASVVGLYPADGVARALWLAPLATPAPTGDVLSLSDWDWSEVRSGIAMISSPIVEAFVPQMLNYESVGGVNFKKGCYPGQEVVARSQFRGTLKRRAYLAHAETTMAVGDEIFTGADEAQPCGLVAQAAACPDGGFDAIVSLQVAAFEAGGLHLASATGPALALAPAPYPLLADV